MASSQLQEIPGSSNLFRVRDDLENVTLYVSIRLQ